MSQLVLHIFTHSEQPDTTAVTHEVVAEPLHSCLNTCSLLPHLHLPLSPSHCLIRLNHL